MRGDQDGAGGVEDPAGQPLGLAGPRAAEHDRHVLDRRPHAQQPDPAQPHRDLHRGQPPPPPPRQLAPATGGRSPARRFTAGPDATRAMSRVEATPALRRDRAPHRVTVADGPRPPVPPDHRQQHPDDHQRRPRQRLRQRDRRQRRDQGEHQRHAAGAALPRPHRRADQHARITTVEALTAHLPSSDGARRHQRRRRRGRPRCRPRCRCARSPTRTRSPSAPPTPARRAGSPGRSTAPRRAAPPGRPAGCRRRAPAPGPLRSA